MRTKPQTDATPIRLWIVEDDAGYRSNLSRSLNLEPGIECSRVFPSCVELFPVLERESHPDILLMDLGLPGMGGVDGIRKLKAVAPEVTVIVLTVFSDKKKVLESLNAGAAGYLLKTAMPDEIVRGLRQVLMGGAALSPPVARLVLDTIRKPDPAETFDLSAREIEVLEKLAEGLSVKAIAAALGIARSTAAGHLEKIYAKLQVQSQSGAVAKALRTGII